MKKTKRLIAFITDSLNKDVESVTFRFDPLYSGGPAYIDGFDAPAFVDLATLRIDPAPKALLEHDPEAVVGRLENIVNDGSCVTCDAVIGGNGGIELSCAYVNGIDFSRAAAKEYVRKSPGRSADIHTCLT